MTLEIVTIPCRQDNYAYLLRDDATGAVGLVDAPEAAPIMAALAARAWQLGTILLTHHHGDHVEGVEALRAASGAEVVGAASDAHRLPPLDRAVAPGDRVKVGDAEAVVLDASGHTIGHVAYHFAGEKALFSADSLMVMGCGRVFEGTPEQMWATLSRLAALPADTRVYSGHEYTEANLRFAQAIDAGNPALAGRAEAIRAARAAGEPTVPATLAEERATNPFLRVADAGLRAAVGLGAASDAEVFAAIRARKDRF
jgi:hydroxyacylglutathione hydrolase